MTQVWILYFQSFSHKIFKCFKCFLSGLAQALFSSSYYTLVLLKVKTKYGFGTPANIWGGASIVGNGTRYWWWSWIYLQQSTFKKTSTSSGKKFSVKLDYQAFINYNFSYMRFCACRTVLGACQWMQEIAPVKVQRYTLLIITWNSSRKCSKLLLKPLEAKNSLSILVQCTAPFL